jgi:phosphosulfolactate synthase
MNTIIAETKVKMKETSTPHFFEGLNGLTRKSKPRKSGLTMVMDDCFGPHAQQDFISVCGEHADYIKIPVGVSRLLSNEVLSAKIKLYRKNQLEPFPGGQYLEYAELNGKTHLYLEGCAKAGYGLVEVSDNLLSVSLEWKRKMIQTAVKDFGLRVLGEVGKKEGMEKDASLLDDAKTCLDAGAEIVLLEAAEIVYADPETKKEIEKVVETVGVEKVLFELPGTWIAGVATEQIHRLSRELIQRYGSHVNLGNVSPLNLMFLEAFRRGIGVNGGSVAE